MFPKGALMLNGESCPLDEMDDRIRDMEARARKEARRFPGRGKLVRACETPEDYVGMRRYSYVYWWLK